MLACAALAGCASSHSVKRAQDQADRAVAATRSLATELQALEKRRDTQEAALARQLAGIEALQGSANAELANFSSRLDTLHRDLLAERAQANRMGRRAPARTASSGAVAQAAANAASEVAAATIAPEANSATAAVFAQVGRQARAIALGSATTPAPAAAPGSLANLGYNAYQSIRYVGQTPPWSGTDFFRLDFHPAGFVFQQGTRIHLIGDNSSAALHFKPGDFLWPSDLTAPLPSRIPVAGFGVSQSFGGGAPETFLDFRGASYFRAAAPGEPFGLSARGIAIDTGVANTAEEFPRYTEFWLGASGGAQFDLVALLTGASVSGAYRFQVRPFPMRTIMYVTATLYLLHNVSQLGLAPLTSMYLEGPSSLNRPDPRVEAVHDSDGLLVHDGDEWSWIPLDNPPRLRIIDVPVSDLRGFGLLQRDRKYSEYRVPDSQYQDHPNAWIQPASGWGQGNIRLIELPAQYPSNDNIVAFWTPANQPAPKQALRLAYRLTWSTAGPAEGRLGRVLATRIADLKNGRYAFMIDFGGGDLDRLPQWVDVQPTVAATDKSIAITNITLKKIRESGHWRLSFDVPAGAGGAQISAELRYGQKILTERWIRQPPGS